jgi:hypothetical protein
MTQAATLEPTTEWKTLTINVGQIPVAVRSANADFHKMLAKRYAGFTETSGGEASLEVEITQDASADPDADLEVRREGSVWQMKRGDFLAEWNAEIRCGRVRQTVNPYSMDSVLRIVHSLLLAEEGGFLLHAASAIRNGRAFLFSGISGAGKTTISGLAPPDATLLTDEVSFVRPEGDTYRAWGTPFAGELAKVGKNCSAPVATLFLLDKGPEHRIEPVSKLDATRALMRNILFFAQDEELVRRVFDSAYEFVHRVPVRRLIFRPDASVWDLIQ